MLASFLEAKSNLKKHDQIWRLSSFVAGWNQQKANEDFHQMTMLES